MNVLLKLQVLIKNIGVLKDEVTANLSTELAKKLNRELGIYKEIFLRIKDDENLKPSPLLIEKTSGISIDGKLSEKDWGKASVLTNFYNVKGKPVTQKTECRILHDGENLYFAFTCFEDSLDKLKASIKERDNDLIFRDDVVEIFINADKDEVFSYYHLAINQLGTVFDEWMYNSGWFREKKENWNGKYEIKSTKNKDRWITEIKIPLKNFKELKGTPESLRINVCRERQAGQREFTSWVLLLKSQFHSPKQFRKAVLK